jgi:hypothetical protein
MCLDNAQDLLHGLVKFVIDNSILKAPKKFHFLSGVIVAHLKLRLCFRATPAKPMSQGLDRWRQDEDRDGLGVYFV